MRCLFSPGGIVFPGLQVNLFQPGPDLMLPGVKWNCVKKMVHISEPLEMETQHQQDSGGKIFSLQPTKAKPNYGRKTVCLSGQYNHMVKNRSYKLDNMFRCIMTIAFTLLFFFFDLSGIYFFIHRVILRIVCKYIGQWNIECVCNPECQLQ